MNKLQTPHPAHVYAEGIRARLPFKLEQARKAAKMSRYRLEKTSGITLQTIGEIERGKTNPSICVVAQLCFGLGMTFTEFAAFMEDVVNPAPGKLVSYDSLPGFAGGVLKCRQHENGIHQHQPGFFHNCQCFCSFPIP